MKLKIAPFSDVSGQAKNRLEKFMVKFIITVKP